MSSDNVIPGLRCAVCKSDVVVPGENASFPFCSARCRLIDLGRWVDGRYAIDVRTGKLDIVDPQDTEEVSDDGSDQTYH